MNIAHVLSRINHGDYDFFINMTDEEVKELSPYVLSLWLRGAKYNRPEHVIMTDLILNSKLFTLHRFPRLLYSLACYANCDMGDTKYYFQNDTKSVKGKELKLVMREFQCDERTGTMYLNFLDDSDIKELTEKYDEVDKT